VVPHLRSGGLWRESGADITLSVGDGVSTCELAAVVATGSLPFFGAC